MLNFTWSNSFTKLGSPNVLQFWNDLNSFSGLFSCVKEKAQHLLWIPFADHLLLMAYLSKFSPLLFGSVYSKPVHSENTTCPIAVRSQAQCETLARSLPIVVPVTAGCPYRFNRMQQIGLSTERLGHTGECGKDAWYRMGHHHPLCKYSTPTCTRAILK